MIPINKQSKKNQKRHYSLGRLSWNEINPSSRIHKSKNCREQRSLDRMKEDLQDI